MILKLNCHLERLWLYDFLVSRWKFSSKEFLSGIRLSSDLILNKESLLIFFDFFDVIDSTSPRSSNDRLLRRTLLGDFFGSLKETCPSRKLIDIDHSKYLWNLNSENLVLFMIRPINLRFQYRRWDVAYNFCHIRKNGSRKLSNFWICDYSLTITVYTEKLLFLLNCLSFLIGLSRKE